MRRALIDADILLYEVGFSSEGKDPDTGELQVASWDFCQDLLEKKIELINDEAEGEGPPLLFLTNTERINKMLNKSRKREGRDLLPFVPNFREALAKDKVYKGTRKAEKPKHFYNILAHLIGAFDTYIDETGLEADDAMCMMQYSRLDKADTIICSRDKDVRMCPGWHYSWEIANQPSIGPIWVDHLGFIEKRNENEFYANGKKKPIKLFGVGTKFFYAQLLMGDVVDNIGGMKGKGPVFAYNLLHDAPNERECYERVSKLYREVHKDEWKTKIKEQADLLWMVKERGEDGQLKLWLPPKPLPLMQVA